MQEQKRIELYSKISNHAIFKNVNKAEFKTFIHQCELKKSKKSERLTYFKTPHEGILIILEGKVEVFIDSEDGLSVLLEVLQAGEMLGFSHIADYLEEKTDGLQQHHFELEFVENTFYLQVPGSVIKERLTDLSVQKYILGKTAARLGTVYASLVEQVKLGDTWGKSESFIRKAKDFMQSPVITIPSDVSIQETAHLMIKKAVSSVLIVNELEQLIGIITERDLVQRVLSKGSSQQLQAVDIMTQSPVTVSPHTYYYNVLSTFFNNRIKHLPVVEHGKVIGMITFQNLISKRDRGAMGILKTIENATYDDLPNVKDAIYDVLTTLISDEISTIHTLEIITQLYDRLARHCVQLAVKALEVEGYGQPPVPFSWYQMGSGARGEQFMVTDQDHFLVYANTEDEAAIQYFSLLGEKIVQFLVQAGYKECDGKMMASEAIWRGSFSTWEKRLQTWLVQSTDEQILLGYNFLSFRFLYGNQALDQTFSDMVQEKFKTAHTFLYYMARQEQDNPIPQFEPSFFNRFKAKGKYETIDIKLHALFPMHHCLQILGVQKNLINRTPLKLVDGLVEAKELSEGFALDIRHAYEVALKARIRLSWKKHLRNESSTTVIQLNAIRRWERDELKTMLKTVHTLQMHLIAKL